MAVGKQEKEERSTQRQGGERGREKGEKRRWTANRKREEKGNMQSQNKEKR